MDAISFVMGEKVQALRVKRMSDLIHGASIGREQSRSATVSAIFELRNGAETKFSRIVTDSRSEHQIDGKVLYVIHLLLLLFSN